MPARRSCADSPLSARRPTLPSKYGSSMRRPGAGSITLRAFIGQEWITRCSESAWQSSPSASCQRYKRPNAPQLAERARLLTKSRWAKAILLLDSKEHAEAAEETLAERRRPMASGVGLT